MIRLTHHRSSLPAWLAPLALACALGAPAGPAAASPSMQADTGSLVFGVRQVGAPAARRTVVVTNTGATDLALDTPSLNIPSGFSVTGDSTCIGVLRAGASCSVTVAYRAKTAGSSRATLTVGTDAQFVRIALSGAGAAPSLQVRPAAYVFPARMLGRNAPPKSFLVSNTAIHAVSLPGAHVQGPFNLVGGGAARAPLTPHPPAAPDGWEGGPAGLAAEPARRVVLGGADDPAMLFLCAAAAGVLVYRWRHHKRTGGHVG